MLTINDHIYTSNDFDEQQDTYLSLSIINQHKTIAVCVKDNFTWLSLCYYFKSQQISVMPLHPSIPLDTAKRMAIKAQCSLLIYDDLTQFIELSTSQKIIDNAGLIQMSSGTTGEPKAILRSWADIDIEINSYRQAFTDAETMIPVVACPISHSYGLICGVMVALARGQHLIIVTNINPKYLIKILLSCDRPLLYSSPVMLKGLISLWPNEGKIFAAMTSGSTMSEQTFEKISQKVEHLYQQYGCSEAGCISIGRSLKSSNDLGKPLPHITLDCSNDRQKPSEIIVSIKTALGAKQIHTQDLGYIDSKGSVCFLARLDDTIIVSGLNVYPGEVEDIILTYPQINDVVIFKIADPFAGERVCLQYVSHQTINPNLLRQWCSKHLAPFQVPQILQQVDNIARMANSKINRQQIANDYKTSTLAAT